MRSRRAFLSEVFFILGQELIDLSSPGNSSVVMSRKNAAQLLKTKADDGDDIGRAIDTVAKAIKADTRRKKLDDYKVRLSKECIKSEWSNMRLMAAMSPKLDHTTRACRAGSIVHSAIACQACW